MTLERCIELYIKKLHELNYIHKKCSILIKNVLYGTQAYDIYEQKIIAAHAFISGKVTHKYENSALVRCKAQQHNLMFTRNCTSFVYKYYYNLQLHLQRKRE